MGCSLHNPDLLNQFLLTQNRHTKIQAFECIQERQIQMLMEEIRELESYTELLTKSEKAHKALINL